MIKEKSIKNNLSQTLKWLSAESILYHAIFLVHQLVLFKIAGIKLYGIVGVIFSLIYFCTAISSFGLESSLSPFFYEIVKNKKNFKRFFAYQIFPSIFLSAIFIPILLLFKNVNKLEKLSVIDKVLPKSTLLFEYFQSNISLFLILTIFLLILSESIKKTLRAILYLIFKNKINMVIEILSIIIYVATIWVYYYLFGTITINTIFVPMAVTSLLSSIALSFFIYKAYLDLPQSNNLIQNTQTKLQLKILKMRAINFINQFTHNLFSSNFLVPFFALQFGLAQAAIFKLLSHICYTITMIMRKIFGWTCDTILAHTKNMEFEQKRTVFYDINNKIYNILFAIIIFLAINLTKIISYTNTPELSINWTLICFFLAITLIENLFISYEKFYIAEEKNGIILLINILSIASLSGVIFYSNNFESLGQSTLLIAITIIRSVFFAIMAIMSFYKWRINPKISFNPIYIALSLFISILFFKLF